MNTTLKRTFDIVFSLVGLLLLSPVFLVVSFKIWREDGRPIFFRQERIGKGGRPFKIWKFRTMFRDAESRGLQITQKEDPRITNSGVWIRKYKIDELPQLFNVLSGEMSFVGPRPEVAKYVKFYEGPQKKVLEVKPGITDPASITYRGEADLLGEQVDVEGFYIREIMPKKLEINLQYLERANVFTDVLIIFKTLVAIVR